MSGLFNPYALTALGKPLQQRQSPELRVETPHISRAQLDMAQHTFVRFLDHARLSRVPNPTQQGRLADGTPYRIVTASGAPIMQVWPVGADEVKRPTEIHHGILLESESGVVYRVGFNEDKGIWEWGYNKYALFGHKSSPIMNGAGYFTYSLERDDRHPAAYIATNKISDKVNPNVLRVTSSKGYVIESDIPLNRSAGSKHVMGHLHEDEIKYVFVRIINDKYSIWVSGAGNLINSDNEGNEGDAVKKPELYGEFQLPIDAHYAKLNITSSGEFLLQKAEPRDPALSISRDSHGKHHVWKAFNNVPGHADIDKFEGNTYALKDHMVSITGSAGEKSNIFFISGLQPYGHREESFYTCEHDATTCKIFLERKTTSPPELIGTIGYKSEIGLPNSPLEDYDYEGFPLTCIATEGYSYKYRDRVSTTLEEKKDCIINAGFYTNFEGDVRQIKFKISGDSSKYMSEEYTSTVGMYAGYNDTYGHTSYHTTAGGTHYDFLSGYKEPGRYVYNGINTTVPLDIVIDCEVADKLRHTAQIDNSELILLDCDFTLTCKMSSEKFYESRLDDCKIEGAGYLSRRIEKFHPEVDLLGITEITLTNIKVADSTLGSILMQDIQLGYRIPVTGVRSYYFCLYIGGEEIYREFVSDEVFNSTVRLMGRGNLGIRGMEDVGEKEEVFTEIKIDMGAYPTTELTPPIRDDKGRLIKKGIVRAVEDPVVKPNGSFGKPYYKSWKHEVDWLEYMYTYIDRGFGFGFYGNIDGANVGYVDTCRGLLHELIGTGLTAPYINYDVAIDPESKGFAVIGEKFKLLVSPDHKVTNVEDLKGLNDVSFVTWCASA